ncbi:hypothetical protein LPJ64_000001 [Coemansia asiatica]|uniref:Uncharacterized protein n=1 Tax=Coemansia asiatica TaxID=1052880 RepID=A0A9W7XSK0_9FUNG|nr:hypothetical protein LPJ64_000001 [Coemansia asiatica]
MFRASNSSSNCRRNKSQFRQDEATDMQEFDWTRGYDWAAYRGVWQTASPDIGSSTAVTPTARGEDISLSGISELKTHLLERLDEQWLMIRQLSQCVQETNRQLGMLTFFMQQHSVYDSIHGDDSAGHRRQARAAAQGPLRFNPDMGKREVAEAGNVGQKIALRMPLERGESLESEYAPSKQADKVSKKRSGVLSIRCIVNTSEQQATAAASKEPEEEPVRQAPQASQLIQAAPPPPAPLLPPLPSIAKHLIKPIKASADQMQAGAGSPGASSHADNYRAPTKERRVPTMRPSASPEREPEPEPELEPNYERGDIAGSSRGAVEAPCPTCSVCKAAAVPAKPSEPFAAGTPIGPAPARPPMSVMQMARMFDKQNRT